MKVFHLSNRQELEFTFTPRVPSNRLPDENKTAKRICVAPSIEDCLIGVHGVEVTECDGTVTSVIISDLFNEVESDVGCSFLHPPTYKRVYIAEADAIKPRKVPDSLYTNELWLMEPTTMVCEGQIGYWWNGRNRYHWRWDPYGDEAYMKMMIDVRKANKLLDRNH